MNVLKKERRDEMTCDKYYSCYRVVRCGSCGEFLCYIDEEKQDCRLKPHYTHAEKEGIRCITCNNGGANVLKG